MFLFRKLKYGEKRKYDKIEKQGDDNTTLHYDHNGGDMLWGRVVTCQKKGWGGVVCEPSSSLAHSSTEKWLLL